MARYKEKIKATVLRKGGMSIKKIAASLGLSKSTISMWCRDIALSEEQIQVLVKNKAEGLKLGQLRAAENKRSGRQRVMADYHRKGELQFQNVSDKECIRSWFISLRRIQDSPPFHFYKFRSTGY